MMALTKGEKTDLAIAKVVHLENHVGWEIVQHPVNEFSSNDQPQNSMSHSGL